MHLRPDLATFRVFPWSEALDQLTKVDLVRDTLGEHLLEHFVTAKREEWLDYITHVSPWEADRYLAMY